MKKQISFLSGTFRCGTSLLRSVINQNPNFHMTPNSIIPSIVWLLNRYKQESDYKNWVNVDVDKQYPNNEQYYDNVIENTFDNYFSQHKEKYILEQGFWGAPENFDLLKKYGFLPAKFIMLVRPLEEILQSWIRVENISNDLVSTFCDSLMQPKGQIGQAVLSLNFLIKHYKKNLLIVKYKNLCSNPKKTIKGIYDFLDIPYYKSHKFTNLDQVDNKNSTHTTLRTDKIERKTYNNKIKIPSLILKKYNTENNLFKKYE